MAAYRQLREDLAKLQRDLGLHHVVRRLADADEERRERVQELLGPRDAWLGLGLGLG